MADEKNYIENDLETILADKIAYHKDQAKYHKQMVEQLKEKLSLLGIDSVPSKSISTDVVHITGTLANFKFRDWKPKVWDALLTANGPKTTSDILKHIDERFIHDKNLRRKGIVVVSNAIQLFLREGKIESIPNNEGRGNKYIIMNPQSVMNGGS